MPEDTTGVDIVDGWISARTSIVSDAGTRVKASDYVRLSDFHNGYARKLIRHMGITNKDRAEALKELAIQAALLF